MPKVKICGLTSADDAFVVAGAGADYAGLNFAGGPRKIQVETAREIIEALGKETQAVAVFMDHKIDEIARVMGNLGISFLQLHGAEDPAMVADLSRTFNVIKTIKIEGADSLKEMDRCAPWAFLLDTKVPGQAGGTGRTFDWSIAAQAAQRARIFLAGGLTPDNVEQAILAANPYGVDAASGVEVVAGRKDMDLVSRFTRIGKMRVETRKVPLAEAKPGQRTAKAVQDPKGRSLLNAGVFLNAAHLRRFERNKVPELWIHELMESPRDNPGEAVELSAQASPCDRAQALSNLLEKAPDNSFARALREEAQKRAGVSRNWF